MRSLFLTVVLLSACTTKPASISSIGVPTVEKRVIPAEGTKKAKTVEIQIPYAVKTEQEGVVLSPYFPHELLDVSGLPKDKVVKDPSSGLLVRVP